MGTMKIVHKEYVKKHKLVIPFADLRDGESGKCVKWFNYVDIGRKMWREGDNFYHEDCITCYFYYILNCKGNREELLVEVERERI